MASHGLSFNSLLDNEDVDEIFTLEEEIASGSFGTVYKVCIFLIIKILFGVNNLIFLKIGNSCAHRKNISNKDYNA